MSKKVRYELEVDGAKGFLAPITFPVAEASLGYIFAEIPKYLAAGGILINSLWVRGSKKLKEGGEDYDEACLQASSMLREIPFEKDGDTIKIPYTDSEGKSKIYTCQIKDKIQRETLEECLGLILPNTGNPKPLTAGKKILFENWIDGDKEIKENDELLIAACLSCYHLVRFKGSKLKKV